MQGQNLVGCCLGWYYSEPSYIKKSEEESRAVGTKSEMMSVSQSALPLQQIIWLHMLLKMLRIKGRQVGAPSKLSIDRENTALDCC